MNVLQRDYSDRGNDPFHAIKKLTSINRIVFETFEKRLRDTGRPRVAASRYVKLVKGRTGTKVHQFLGIDPDWTRLDAAEYVLATTSDTSG